jgi:hypothetical protein
VGYALIVVTGSFLLTSLKISFIMSNLGTLSTELLEMPFMYIVIVYAKQQTISRFALPDSEAVRLLTGLIGVGIMVGMEMLTNWLLFGSEAVMWVRERDAKSEAAYLGMLGMLAFIPNMHLGGSA